MEFLLFSTSLMLSSYCFLFSIIHKSKYRSSQLRPNLRTWSELKNRRGQSKEENKELGSVWFGRGGSDDQIEWRQNFDQLFVLPKSLAWKLWLHSDWSSELIQTTLSNPMIGFVRGHISYARGLVGVGAAKSLTLLALVCMVDYWIVGHH